MRRRLAFYEPLHKITVIFAKEATLDLNVVSLKSNTMNQAKENRNHKLNAHTHYFYHETHYCLHFMDSVNRHRRFTRKSVFRGSVVALERRIKNQLRRSGFSFAGV